MEYLIDYDSRSVLFQSDKAGELTKYIDKNGLRLAVGVIADSDELSDQLTAFEIVAFYILMVATQKAQAGGKCLLISDNRTNDLLTFSHVIVFVGYPIKTITL